HRHRVATPQLSAVRVELELAELDSIPHAAILVSRRNEYDCDRVRRSRYKGCFTTISGFPQGFYPTALLTTADADAILTLATFQERCVMVLLVNRRLVVGTLTGALAALVAGRAGASSRQATAPPRPPALPDDQVQRFV